MREEIQLSRFGRIGFRLLIILLILLLGATMGVIIGSKTRIKMLEDRVVRLEAIDSRVTEMPEKARAYIQFEKRLDRLEASLSSRTDPIAKGPDRLLKKMVEERSQKVESQASPKINKKISKKRFHTVRTGETLYSISRHYGLTVIKIQRLNKIADRSVIHPGQKLLITL
jgi:LysM repeat protein